MLFFALHGSELLGRRVTNAGGFAQAPHEERDFDGGEHKARPLVSVRGKDVYVLHRLNASAGSSVNDRLMRLLLFLATCRDNGAARVTAVVPYLSYGRKDRQTKPRDPVTTRSVARLFEAVGTDMIVTLDVHNLMAFQNAFRCRSLHLEARALFAADIAARSGPRPVTVLSPDSGGVKRAELLRETLAATANADIGFGFLEKRRSGGVVSGSLFAGEVEGTAVHIVDDMIVGGGTLHRAAAAAREHGAVEVHALATHGLLSDETTETLAQDGLLDTVTITDSTAPFTPRAGALEGRLRVLECAPLIAAALRALHYGSPITDLPAGALRTVPYTSGA